jgi:hypothetical protein
MIRGAHAEIDISDSECSKTSHFMEQATIPLDDVKVANFS